MPREQVREFEREFNEKGEPLCQTPGCDEICQKFKNGNWRKYCDLHDGYSLMRERYWSLFKIRALRGSCVKCGNIENLEVDHIVALMNGGEMWNEDNLQTLCKNCHKEKTKEDFRLRRENHFPPKSNLLIIWKDNTKQCPLEIWSHNKLVWSLK